MVDGRQIELDLEHARTVSSERIDHIFDHLSVGGRGWCDNRPQARKSRMVDIGSERLPSDSIAPVLDPRLLGMALAPYGEQRQHGFKRGASVVGLGAENVGQTNRVLMFDRLPDLPLDSAYLRGHATELDNPLALALCGIEPVALTLECIGGQGQAP